ncbi:unnamed protein product [Phyllotreta striolata]|uniref:CCAAT/enhancer-binding protein zeta n=1 Tax=Phyllotreta striolata TaxID=444603 RepID=A0A9N9TMM4_PHYSR|nr:unnamed protein product [Phyllotreta striolata]
MKIKNRNFPSNGAPHKDLEDLEEYSEPKKWYEDMEEDPKDAPKYTEQVLIELKDEAKKCHESEVLNYNSKNLKTNSNYQWMKTVMSKGTLSDKIAANTIMIQDNPIVSLETVRNLVNMVKVGKKKECMSVMETLTDLFVSNLLIDGRKLKSFHQRPLSMLNELSSGNAVTRRKLLNLWYFEDQLKEIYALFVLALSRVAQDTVDSNKEKAITAMYKLLESNPEQEKNLLTYIVNKLGDPSQKVASKVIYCLTKLLFKHNNMQLVVLNEIEKLMFRPNVSTRAQYYSLCFLSQFHLNPESNNVPRKLIDVYFSFFKACVKTGDIDTRMMSALLTGLNRAYPYAKMDFENIQEHIDTMYRLVHIANFNISLHTLNLLYQVSDSGKGITDRFYAALYRKLFDSNVLNTTHKAMLLSLVYKALLKDKEPNRVKLFVKRLLQISLYAQPCYSCGILYLISQLMNKRGDIKAFVMKRSEISAFENDEDEEKYHDIKEETIEIKEESDNEDEVKEEITTNGLVEIKEEPVDEDDVKPKGDASSWYHCRNGPGGDKTHKYNPLARNPLYGGGEFSAYIELNYLKNHFHPTVSLFATNLLNNEPVTYNGDPLNDFTLIRFLERFVFKNPKKTAATPGRDLMFSKRKLYRPKGVKSLPVKSESYSRENPRNIPVDELFVHTYLQGKYREGGSRDDDDSDLESVRSDEFEEMLDKMAGAKTNEEPDELDYLNEIGSSLKENKKKTRSKEETADDDDDGDDDEDENLSDDFFSDNEEFSGEDDDELEMNDDDKDLLDDLSEDDAESIEFSDEEESNRGKKGKNKKSNDIMSNFASVEEFATLLEDEGSSKIKPGGSNAFANKDDADVKQLSWEENRNRWLNKFDRTVGGRSKKFSKKRNKSQGSNNSKRRRNNMARIIEAIQPGPGISK